MRLAMALGRSEVVPTIQGTHTRFNAMEIPPKFKATTPTPGVRGTKAAAPTATQLRRMALPVMGKTGTTPR